ncbi:MAG: 50S ribosomal protein L13 [Pontiellaceae bacterium]|nr:50S ribosomal protein L13 [Pontiellaceae bacterium]MBN2785065.1 50S ribosomal protein L13 [Pontiellaceae bacterium]
MKTFMPKEADIKREWFVVDATDKPAGRLAVLIADVLRGRDKPTYTPHVDTGAFVVVVNADKIKLTGNKENNKIYQDFSGYNSGLTETKAKDIREKNPERIIEQAVKGMLPANRQSRQTLKRLKVYAGATHPHEAQQVKPLELNF